MGSEQLKLISDIDEAKSIVAVAKDMYIYILTWNLIMLALSGSTVY